MTLTSWDVIVIGGGPAGAIAALVLARAGRRVLLADRARRAHAYAPAIGEALPPAARPLLRDLGLLPRVIADGHLDCHANASAWGSDDLRIHDFLFDVHGSGWHLDRARFDASLREAAAAAGVHVLDDARIDARINGPIDARNKCGTGARTVSHDDHDGDRDRDRAGLAGHTNREAREPRQARLVRLRAHGRDELIRCRWIVDASGRAATAAIACGARRQSTDRLIAIWSRFAPTSRPGQDDALESRPTGTSPLIAPPARRQRAVGGPDAEPRPIDCDSRTLIESCADGWWYSALLPSRERMVAFFTDSDLAARHDLRAMRAPDGRGLMSGIARTTHLRDLLHASGYVMRGRPRGADASSSRLDRVVGPGWIAAGDAALAFDPLSSQGIFNALYTGMQAGRAVHSALSGDDGADGELHAYATRIDDIHHHYLRNLAAAYTQEARWSDHPFWRRRQRPLIAAPASPAVSSVNEAGSGTGVAFTSS